MSNEMTKVDVFCNICKGLIKITPAVERKYTPETMGGLIHNTAYCATCKTKVPRQCRE